MKKADNSKIAGYLLKYIQAYREEYEKFTAPPSRGGGFPKLPISPYLGGKDLLCLILRNGVVLVDKNSEPQYKWWIAGGPALKVDYNPSVTPDEIIKLLKQEGIFGKPIGIYRIVSKEILEDSVWRGNLGNYSNELKLRISDDQLVRIQNFPLSVKECLIRMTYGALGQILDIKLPDEKSDFWIPHIIRNIGFFPADLNSRAFYNYIEISPHLDVTAWDNRSVAIRVKADLRRDFASYMAYKNGESGGSLSFGADQWIERYTSVLDNLKKAIDGFENLLYYQNDAYEEVFHKYLKKNTILLDVYGECESKPKFKYPSGQKSPIGKSYVEPDFIVSYPNESYKLVELERANKDMTTKQGHPKQDFNQAAFQIGEWIHYIKNHYQKIKDRYPGIASKYTTSVVMSRSKQSSFGGYQEMKSYIELMKETSAVDEILTYDDLLERAKAIYTKLASLEIA